MQVDYVCGASPQCCLLILILRKSPLRIIAVGCVFLYARRTRKGVRDLMRVRARDDVMESLGEAGCPQPHVERSGTWGIIVSHRLSVGDAILWYKLCYLRDVPARHLPQHRHSEAPLPYWLSTPGSASLHLGLPTTRVSDAPADIASMGSINVFRPIEIYEAPADEVSDVILYLFSMLKYYIASQP